MVKAAVLASLVGAAQAAHWAVLVAGSNSYSNYRHQADVCHSYQVVKSKGIPDENIIVMAYDDIANNARNPFPGKLFNKPTAAGVEGVDVYAGCNIDYKGADVTPANFAAVMTGTASGKKLESTADDNVFVFFSDHGAAGLIAFPSDTMHKAEFQQVFETMHSKSMYKKLTFYLETCESGSMFEGMSTPGVYGLSAASPSESSWGTYCGADAMVNGQSVGSCLGDLFSVNWMEDSDAVDITSESLSDQFATVKTTTSKSAVMQWGDLTFQDDKVSEYQGAASAANGAKSENDSISYSARQVDLQQAYDNYLHAKTGAARVAAGEELQGVISEQIAVEQAYENFLHIVYPEQADKRKAARENKEQANQFDCEMAARKSFVENGKFNSFTGFALQFQQRVVNVCADLAKSGMNIDVAEAAKQACNGATLV
jgi:legumain